ncbi:hypothetical protein PUMCH_005180 [Australozyma saopauloensis]|uniref:Uncharacterized protein n=1 Tax=Australozyma saopauloensis TaxID=291208 RepID=A0AAX4HIK0_9ASCO|nr:hypothetical protein PUMCH_005180 [[Candida] saopauloensis]
MADSNSSPGLEIPTHKPIVGCRFYVDTIVENEENSSNEELSVRHELGEALADNSFDAEVRPLLRQENLYSYDIQSSCLRCTKLDTLLKVHRCIFFGSMESVKYHEFNYPDQFAPGGEIEIDASCDTSCIVIQNKPRHGIDADFSSLNLLKLVYEIKWTSSLTWDQHPRLIAQDYDLFYCEVPEEDGIIRDVWRTEASDVESVLLVLKKPGVSKKESTGKVKSDVDNDIGSDTNAERGLPLTLLSQFSPLGDNYLIIGKVEVSNKLLFVRCLSPFLFLSTIWKLKHDAFMAKQHYRDIPTMDQEETDDKLHSPDLVFLGEAVYFPNSKNNDESVNINCSGADGLSEMTTKSTMFPAEVHLVLSSSMKVEALLNDTNQLDPGGMNGSTISELPSKISTLHPISQNPNSAAPELAMGQTFKVKRSKLVSVSREFNKENRHNNNSLAYMIFDFHAIRYFAGHLDAFSRFEIPMNEMDLSFDTLSLVKIENNQETISTTFITETPGPVKLHTSQPVSKDLQGSTLDLSGKREISIPIEESSEAREAREVRTTIASICQNFQFLRMFDDLKNTLTYRVFYHPDTDSIIFSIFKENLRPMIASSMSDQAINLATCFNKFSVSENKKGKTKDIFVMSDLSKLKARLEKKLRKKLPKQSSNPDIHTARYEEHDDHGDHEENERSDTSPKKPRQQSLLSETQLANKRFQSLQSSGHDSSYMAGDVKLRSAKRTSFQAKFQMVRREKALESVCNTRSSTITYEQSEEYPFPPLLQENLADQSIVLEGFDNNQALMGGYLDSGTFADFTFNSNLAQPDHVVAQSVPPELSTPGFFNLGSTEESDLSLMTSQTLVSQNMSRSSSGLKRSYENSEFMAPLDNPSENGSSFTLPGPTTDSYDNSLGTAYNWNNENHISANHSNWTHLQAVDPLYSPRDVGNSFLGLNYNSSQPIDVFSLFKTRLSCALPDGQCDNLGTIRGRYSSYMDMVASEPCFHTNPDTAQLKQRRDSHAADCNFLNASREFNASFTNSETRLDSLHFGKLVDHTIEQPNDDGLDQTEKRANSCIDFTEDFLPPDHHSVKGPSPGSFKSSSSAEPDLGYTAEFTP